MTNPGPLRQFMVFSIVSVTVILAAMVYFHIDLRREYLKDHLSAHNRNLAVLLRNSLLAEGLEDALRSAPDSLSDEMQGRIQRSLKEELRWLPVVKVKVFGPDSRILFSTLDSEIGRMAVTNPGVASALAGNPVSDLVKRNHPNDFDGTLDRIDLHQQYIPIRDSANDRILGVFETYVDVSKTLAHVDSKQQVVFWSIGGILASAYLLFTILFLRTHRALHAERLQREAHLGKLVEIQSDLERRVLERTAELGKSKQFLQSVIDGIGNPLLVIRPDYTISLMNRAARNLLPDPNDTSRFRHCYQVSHRRDTPCDGDDHPCSFAAVMRHGKTARVRHTHYDANDEPIIVDLVTTPLYADNGEFEGVIEVEHDVTQMIRMQAGLVESEARLQAIMDNVPDAILTCDRDCIIQSANPSALRMFRATEIQLLGRDFLTLVSDPDMADAIEPMTVAQMEIDAQRLDHSEFPADVWIGPMLGDDGGARHIVVVRDISAKRTAEEELAKTRQQYFHQEKMAAIGHLAAGILHEVGNPIAAIAGAAAELKTNGYVDDTGPGDWSADDSVSRNIELIDKQTERLAKITREIADFASPRPRERELLDLNGLLQSTARLLSYDRRFRFVRLELDLDSQLPAIFGVADQLTQLVMNLLINAMDACSELDDREPAIVMTSRLDGDRVHVTIADNGSGIPSDVLARVTEPFFTTKPVGKGTGLGLSLSDSIALAHGGYLQIDSTEDVGTTVSLVLPSTFVHSVEEHLPEEVNA